ncbi:MAG: hypothetical protein JW889_15210 [Verrucomicrobia bacterium]|nr:hypothetical protein [Verrucomicrobiota bacterium]
MRQIARISVLAAVVVAAGLLSGCGETTYVREPVLVGVPLPMTTDEVVGATKSGATEDVILAQLQGRGYEGALTAKDVDQLRAEGVPDGVIDWMLANPSAPPMRSARIVGQEQVVYVDRAPDVVYVDRYPDVVVVERPPRVTYSIGVGYTWGNYRYYDRPYYRDRYYRSSYPRTRVYHSGSSGRVYRYTSGR